MSLNQSIYDVANGSTMIRLRQLPTAAPVRYEKLYGRLTSVEQLMQQQRKRKKRQAAAERHRQTLDEIQTKAAAATAAAAAACSFIPRIFQSHSLAPHSLSVPVSPFTASIKISTPALLSVIIIIIITSHCVSADGASDV